MASTKKIAAGYYTATYKNISFEITKSETLNSEILWYWQIGNSKVHDFYPSKSIAIKAATEYINELTTKI
jgi:hypothetical protein